MEPTTLHGARLVLDALLDTDIDDTARYCRDPLFEEFVTTPWPYRRADAENFVRDFAPGGWASGEELTWAIRRESGARLLGVIGFRTLTSSVGFWMGREHRGYGFMTEALQAVADQAFEAGADRVSWECVTGNHASAAVARKAGFTFTGEYPAAIPARDGSFPAAWHGELLPGPRMLQPGWPGEATSPA